MQAPPSSLRRVVEAELPRLHAVAYHMSGSRTDAYERLREMLSDAATDGGASVLAAARPGDALLARLAHHLEEVLGRKAEKSFQILDDILRDDITQPIDLNVKGIDGDPNRVHPLLWELKRTCLTAVLGCLPPGVRISFLLTDLLGYSPSASAELLGINESAYRVRLTRARKRLENYLAPRCQHMDRQNPCNCEGRLGVALEKGFLAFPPHTADIPHAPHVNEVEHREMGALYRSLPTVTVTDAQLAELLALCPDEPPSLDIEIDVEPEPAVGE
jgi:DNA-directed RNA polymerase specialized sigma24 family protein